MCVCVYVCMCVCVYVCMYVYTYVVASKKYREYMTYIYMYMYMYETSCGMLWPLAVINEITTPATKVIYHISLEWDYKQHITVKSRKCIDI